MGGGFRKNINIAKTIKNKVRHNREAALCTPLYNFPLGGIRTLSHYGLAKKARPIKAGSHNLYYQLNDLNAEKIPAGPAVIYSVTEVNTTQYVTSTLSTL